jgi:hypothetical protein
MLAFEPHAAISARQHLNVVQQIGIVAKYLADVPMPKSSSRL